MSSIGSILRRAVRTRFGAGALLLGWLAAAGCTEIKRWAYEGGDRDAWQQPGRVIAALGVQSGDRVADLGSGSGYFTVWLAEAVGDEGRVVAVDVDEAMNEALRADLVAQGIANVDVVLATPEAPGLEPASVDLIFSSNTYHHIDDRVVYFSRLREALAGGGRVALIDFVPDGFWQRLHATDVETIRAEMAAAGYRPIARFDFLERQSFEIFAADRAGL